MRHVRVRNCANNCPRVTFMPSSAGNAWTIPSTSLATTLRLHGSTDPTNVTVCLTSCIRTGATRTGVGGGPWGGAAACCSLHAAIVTKPRNRTGQVMRRNGCTGDTIVIAEITASLFCERTPHQIRKKLFSFMIGHFTKQDNHSVFRRSIAGQVIRRKNPLLSFCGRARVPVPALDMRQREPLMEGTFREYGLPGRDHCKNLGGGHGFRSDEHPSGPSPVPCDQVRSRRR